MVNNVKEQKVQDQAYFEAALMVAKLTEENEWLREEVERSYHKGRSEGEEIGYQMGYDEGYKEGLREERE